MRVFIASSPAIQEILKCVLQAESKRFQAAFPTEETKEGGTNKVIR